MVDSGQNLPESEGKGQSFGQDSFLTKTWGSLKTALIGCSAALVFGLVVLLMSILSITSPEGVLPQQEAATAAATVEYYLPYPGILPDNPLYKIKAARDWVRFWLTFDEVAKAKRELLYADKRIGAAVALAEGGKANLAVTTATKAEKYLERAVNRTQRLSTAGKDVTSLQRTLSLAVAKHRQILTQNPQFSEALKLNLTLQVY